ncbi:TPA: hypothetical protein ACHTQ5_001180 [Pseudomonas aeruginosa]
MSSTQHQLIEQCAIRLRGIVEALDNIHDTIPHRWSTDLDDVHSSAESLLALIKDQAPTQAAQGLAGAALAPPSPKREQRLVECDACPTSGGCVEKCMKAPTQPSPAQTQPSPAPTLRAAIDVANARFEVPVAKWGTNLVGEEEQPEVVARVDGTDEDWFIQPEDETEMHNEGLLFAGCELGRMVDFDLFVGALRAENAKLIEAIDECDGDRWKLRSERDAANARLHEVATACATAEQQRDAALARVAELESKLAELEKQEPVALANRGNQCFWVKWTEAAAGLYGPGIKLYAAPVAQAQQLNDLDKQCRDDVARALGLRPNQERGFAWSYLLASIKSCVKASGDSAQAQHSVPDGAADLCRFLAKLYCELDGLRYSTAKLPAEQIADALIFKWPVLQGARNQLNIKRISEQPYDESKLHSAIAAMLAAAPDKEVPQAWLDVQAERRRQVEAEGWTPKHDDEHADGQMAQAAGCYALHAGGIGTDWPDGRQNGAALFWPWDKDSWKPTTPRRDLVKACALALAEIERLDRAAATQGGPSDA